MRCTAWIASLAAGLWLAIGTVAEAQEFKAGPLTVVQPWTRATPGGSTVGAAYLEIRAPQGVEDKLIGARSPAAGTIELHDHVHESGVMKMRRLEAIAVKGQGSVTLAPGRLHLMLMGLKAPLAAGSPIEITLVFEKAGEVAVEAQVLGVGAPGPGGPGARGAHRGH
jgi:copper(I)-binding protein